MLVVPSSLFMTVVVLWEFVNGQYGGGQQRRFYNNVRLGYRHPVSSGSSQVGTYTFVSSNANNNEAQVPKDDSTKIRLDVYYETDCPDSMRFITRQLYPLYQEMEDVLDVNLYPYGKAYEVLDEETGRYNYYCQHGASECYGNAVQSCVLSLYPMKRDQMDFINCMEIYPRPSQSGPKCARRQSLDWDRIDKCATGEEGRRLTHEMAQATQNLKPSLTFVPWIVFDKVFSMSNHRRAQWNLKAVVCDSYKGSHPKCEK